MVSTAIFVPVTSSTLFFFFYGKMSEVQRGQGLAKATQRIGVKAGSPPDIPLTWTAA